jgi:hemerythrin-like metal-binding protein
MTKRKLEWEEVYSVGVEEIDNQHKKLFEIINTLIDTATKIPDKAEISRIIETLIVYKKIHFDTEEKYFKEFKYEGSEEHIAEHKRFNLKLTEIMESNQSDGIALSYALVDFLEDWLVGHLMGLDQKYKSCFHEHGLK